MQPNDGSIGELVDASKHFARQMLVVGGNRFDLLMAEVQEERERFLHALLLVLVAVGCGLLSIVSLNVALIVWLWPLSPAGVPLVSALLYAAGAVCLYRRVVRLLGEWKMLSATIDQLRKDRECLGGGPL